MWEQCE